MGLAKVQVVDEALKEEMAQVVPAKEMVTSLDCGFVPMLDVVKVAVPAPQETPVTTGVTAELKVKMHDAPQLELTAEPSTATGVCALAQAWVRTTMVDVAEVKETKSEAQVPNETRVLELKAEPVSVTSVPPLTEPELGEMEAM